MTKNANYRFNVTKKVIEANIPALTAEELEAVNRYQTFGYEVIPVSEKDLKLARKLEKNANKSAENESYVSYKKDTIIAFLESDIDKVKGFTVKAFKEEIYKPSNKVYKQDTANGKHKAGERKTRGFVGAVKWFKKQLKDNNLTDKYIEFCAEEFAKSMQDETVA